MSPSPMNPEIHVHGVDGHVAAFGVRSPEALERLIEQIDPNRVFTQPFLTIAGSDSLSVFPCRSVARVDLVMDGFPEWPFHERVADVRELSEAEFRRIAVTPLALRDGELSSLFAEVELTNGDHLFLELQVRTEARIGVDFRMLLQSYLSAPSHYARRSGGGVIVLNPEHFLRLRMHPGPPATPPGAWMAEPLGEALGASLDIDAFVPMKAPLPEAIEVESA